MRSWFPRTPSSCRAPPGLAACARGGFSILPVRRLPSYCPRTGDDVLYSKTSAPPIPYPPTRAPALPIIVLRSCVAALERKLPAKSALSSVQRVTAFTVPSGKKRAKNRPPPDTVLSRKNIPYRPTNSCSPTFRRFHGGSLVYNIPANRGFSYRLASAGGIPYSPTSFTVPGYKLYRTAPQALPYRPARDTVLSGKLYRTRPQNMAYPPAKAARDAPAKHKKSGGGRFERPVVVSC